MYRALIRRDETLTQMDLRPFFISAETESADQRLFASFRKWWSEIGRTQLAELPGVRSVDGGLRFVGIDPANAEDMDLVLDLGDDELVRPLEDIRNDPSVRARIAAEDLHGPEPDDVERLMDLFSHVCTAGRISSEELARRSGTVRSPNAASTLPDLSEFERDLERLPGIRRAREDTRPEDVQLSELETPADLDTARERIEANSTVVWRHVPGS